MEASGSYQQHLLGLKGTCRLHHALLYLSLSESTVLYVYCSDEVDETNDYDLSTSAERVVGHARYSILHSRAVVSLLSLPPLPLSLGTSLEESLGEDIRRPRDLPACSTGETLGLPLSFG